MPSISNVKKKYFGTKSQVYFKTVLFFILSILVVFIHGVSQRDVHDYHEAELYEEHIVSQGNLSVVKKVFNEEENSFRMDLFFNPTSQSIEDMQRKIEATLVTNANPEQPIEVNVVPVTSRYFVLFAEGIEDEADIVRLNISYFPTAETSQSLTFYASKEYSEIENISLMQVNERNLQVDSIQNDIRIQDDLIQTSEERTSEIEAEIALRLKLYEQLTEEKKFQVGSELQETENKIASIRTTLLTLQTQLEDEKLNRNEIKERIDLLETRIKEINEPSE